MTMITSLGPACDGMGAGHGPGWRGQRDDPHQLLGFHVYDFEDPMLPHPEQFLLVLVSGECAADLYPSMMALPLSHVLWSGRRNTYAFGRRRAGYLSAYYLTETTAVITRTKYRVHIIIFVQDVLHLISSSLLTDYCHVRLHSAHCALSLCWSLVVVVSIVCDLRV